MVAKLGEMELRSPAAAHEPRADRRRGDARQRPEGQGAADPAARARSAARLDSRQGRARRRSRYDPEFWADEVDRLSDDADRFDERDVRSACWCAPRASCASRRRTIRGSRSCSSASSPRTSTSRRANFMYETLLADGAALGRARGAPRAPRRARARSRAAGRGAAHVRARVGAAVQGQAIAARSSSTPRCTATASERRVADALDRRGVLAAPPGPRRARRVGAAARPRRRACSTGCRPARTSCSSRSRPATSRSTRSTTSSARRSSSRSPRRSSRRTRTSQDFVAGRRHRRDADRARARCRRCRRSRRRRRDAPTAVEPIGGRRRAAPARCRRRDARGRAARRSPPTAAAGCRRAGGRGRRRRPQPRGRSRPPPTPRRLPPQAAPQRRARAAPQPPPRCRAVPADLDAAMEKAQGRRGRRPTRASARGRTSSRSYPTAQAPRRELARVLRSARRRGPSSPTRSRTRRRRPRRRRRDKAAVFLELAEAYGKLNNDNQVISSLTQALAPRSVAARDATIGSRALYEAKKRWPDLVKVLGEKAERTVDGDRQGRDLSPGREPLPRAVLEPGRGDQGVREGPRARPEQRAGGRSPARGLREAPRLGEADQAQGGRDRARRPTPSARRR